MMSLPDLSQTRVGRSIRRRKQQKSMKLNDSGTKNLLKMFEKPNKEKEVPSGAFTPQSSKARLEFFKTFRNIKRIGEFVALQQTKSNLNIAFLSQCEKEKLQPKPMGLLKNQGNGSRFTLGRNSLSERYVGAFSSALSELKSLKTIDINRNQLSDKSVSSILNHVRPLSNLTEINVSYNSIGMNSLKHIISLLDTDNPKMKSVNFEGCALRDSDVVLLCESLSLNDSVTFLNLAKNGLMERAGCALGSMLKTHRKLRYLDLHWNKLSQNGASELFSGLSENTSVLELDVSWNSLGTAPYNLIPSLSEFFKTNKTVRHLDISYNALGLRDCQILAEALRENHTILGLHVLGNSCDMDSLGFMIPTNIALVSLNRHPDKRILVKDKNKLGEKCWVCEKWVETVIVYQALITNNNPVFIHFDIDGYVPIPMSVNNNQVNFTRVLPDKPAKLFFSDLTGKILPQVRMKTLTVKPTAVYHLKYCEAEEKEVRVARMNILTPNGFECDIKDPFEVLPRTPLPKYKQPEDSVPVPSWDFSSSIFKDYTLDSPELITKCFEFDWTHSKISKLPFKEYDDLETSKKLLKEAYSLIKDAYRIMSMNNSAEIFTLSSNSLFEFLSLAKLLNTHFGTPDIGVNWNAVIQPKIKGQKYNPGNALVRYEFLEFLVRTAIDKYLRNGQVQKISEAIKKLLEEVHPLLRSYNFHEWRSEYFCEEIDFLYKNNENLLRMIYNRFSGKKTLPGRKRFMSLEEFHEMCDAIGCLANGSTTRIVDCAFGAAMMTQEDELYKKKHMEMDFLEFLEALARVAATMNFTFKEDGRTSVLLYEKVEALIPLLLNASSTYMLTRMSTIQRMDNSIRVSLNRQATFQS